VTLATIAKAALVALIAAVCSGLPMIALLTWDMDAGLRLTSGFGFLVLALFGNFLIGLPIALLTYRSIRDEESFGRWHLIGWANLIASMIVLALTAIGGLFVTIFYGIPIFIAANAFAVAGWFIVIKPARAKA
jgi:hypothetical protein